MIQTRSTSPPPMMLTNRHEKTPHRYMDTSAEAGTDEVGHARQGGTRMGGAWRPGGSAGACRRGAGTAHRSERSPPTRPRTTHPARGRRRRLPACSGRGASAPCAPRRRSGRPLNEGAESPRNSAPHANARLLGCWLCRPAATRGPVPSSY